MPDILFLATGIDHQKESVVCPARYNQVIYHATLLIS